MSKKGMICFFICLIVSLMIACGGSSSQTSDRNAASGDDLSFDLKSGHNQTTTHPYHIGSEAFASKINELTDGKINISIYPNSQLGGEIAMIESVQMGNLDFVLAATVNIANFDSAFTVYDYPFLFKNREHAYAVVDSDFSKTKLENLKKIGLVAFEFWENGFFDIMNNKRPITKISDMRGLNIRTMQNPVYMAAVAAMGANPVPMPPAELYTALQNGTVDGNCLSVNAMYSYRLYEVQNTYMRTDMFFGAMTYLMSKMTYDKMPDSYQEALTQAGKYAAQVERKATIDQEDVNLAAIIDYGMQITKPENREDWIKLMQEKVYPQFTDKVPLAELETIRNLVK
jgi:tripartite ATP-independent transporter DctP family solute receptor